MGTVIRNSGGGGDVWRGRGSTVGKLSALAPMLLVPAVAAAGAVYQILSTTRDRQRFKAPGKLVMVDGKRLHLLPGGAGNPTVLLETGLGSMCSAWGWIQPELEKFTRVVSYDRPGLGWSEPEAEYSSAQERMRKLYCALQQGGLSGPYLLVGHSMGGMLVRVFHDLYPDEVVGALLIDPSHPDQHLKSSAIRRHMTSGFRMLRNVQPLARMGYVRLCNFFASQAHGLPFEQLSQASSFLCSSQHLKHTNREAQHWDELCAEVRAGIGLGNKPLTVLSAGKGVLPGTHELHGDLARLSSNSRHVVVEGADHVTLVTHREHALQVASEIQCLVETIRSHPC